MKEGIKNLKTATLKFIENFSLFIKQSCQIVWSVKKIQKIKNQKLKRNKMEE